MHSTIKKLTRYIQEQIHNGLVFLHVSKVRENSATQEEMAEELLEMFESENLKDENSPTL